MTTAQSASIACAGIVLCGGHSHRMGYPKAMLPFGSESLLARVVRLLGEAVQPLVVVAAPAQPLPELPGDVRIVRDRNPDRGPLEGLAAGLAALANTPCQAAYLTGCDYALLRPAFVRRMVERLGDYQLAVPFVDGLPHPLAAVYRCDIEPHVQRLLQVERKGPVHLIDRCHTRLVGADELTDIDPRLESLANVNRAEDYFHALQRCGLEAPRDLAHALGKPPQRP